MLVLPILIVGWEQMSPHFDFKFIEVPFLVFLHYTTKPGETEGIICSGKFLFLVVQ